MVDGYRFPQHSAGNYYYPPHTQPHYPRHSPRNETPPPKKKNIRPAFSTDPSSPSRSPDPQPPTQRLYGMFNQGHQQGHMAVSMEDLVDNAYR